MWEISSRLLTFGLIMSQAGNITCSNVFVVDFFSSYNCEVLWIEFWGLVCKLYTSCVFFRLASFHYSNLGFCQPKGLTYWSKIKGSNIDHMHPCMDYLLPYIRCNLATFKGKCEYIFHTWSKWV